MQNYKKFQTNCPYSLSRINNNFRYWNKLLKTRKSLWEIKIIFTHIAGKIGLKNLVSVQVIEDAGMNELSLTHFSYSSPWNNTVISSFQIFVFNTPAGRRYSLYCKSFPSPHPRPDSSSCVEAPGFPLHALALPAAGWTETHYFKYIRHSLKQKTWSHSLLCLIPVIPSEQLQGLLRNTLWKLLPFLIQSQKSSAPLNTNTAVETQIGPQKSGFPLTLTAINKAYFLLSITF